MKREYITSIALCAKRNGFKGRISKELVFLGLGTTLSRSFGRVTVQVPKEFSHIMTTSKDVVFL